MPKLRDVIGHQRQRDALQQDINTENVSHAYLFSGPRSIGKMTTAFWFAEQLLSNGSPEDTKPETRRRIERLTHPDLLVLDQLWIEKECEDWDTIAQTSNISQVHRSKKPSPAKTDTISIDDIRALQNRLYEKSLGARRCCIIRSMERMQAEAATAFLKILEEPPVGLTFVLTTQSATALLPTITSRTRLLPFQRLSHKELRTFLHAVDEEEAAFILHVAQGAAGIVQRLCDKPDCLLQERQVQNAATTFWETPSLRRKLQILAPLQKRGKDADQLALHLALTVRSQPFSVRSQYTAAYVRALRALSTNANRKLVTQVFALEVEQC
jgi:DNA polymerase III subunit delta'